MELWIAWFHEAAQGEEVKVIATTAEHLGFTGIALSDHVALPKLQKSVHPLLGTPYDPLSPNVEPFTVAATMAAVTEKLRFMTYALVAGMRDPFTIAKLSVSLSDLSGGRFDLGITTGWSTDEIELLGHDPATRGERFNEALEIMKGVWNNDLFSFSGKHHQFTEVGVSPRPKIAPKLLIGGNSKKSLLRAKDYDGWIGMNISDNEVTTVCNALIGDTVKDDKKIYIVPAEELSTDYIQRMEDQGVTGLITMPWMPGDPSLTTEQKCTAMKNLANQYL